MVSAFLLGSNYVHRQSPDLFFTIVSAERSDAYWMLNVLWKRKSDKSLVASRAFKICVHNSLMIEYFSWQR